MLELRISVASYNNISVYNSNPYINFPKHHERTSSPDMLYTEGNGAAPPPGDA